MSIYELWSKSIKMKILVNKKIKKNNTFYLDQKISITALWFYILYYIEQYIYFWLPNNVFFTTDHRPSIMFSCPFLKLIDHQRLWQRGTTTIYFDIFNLIWIINNFNLFNFYYRQNMRTNYGRPQLNRITCNL